MPSFSTRCPLQAERLRPPASAPLKHCESPSFRNIWLEQHRADSPHASGQGGLARGSDAFPCGTVPIRLPTKATLGNVGFVASADFAAFLTPSDSVFYFSIFYFLSYFFWPLPCQLVRSFQQPRQSLVFGPTNGFGAAHSPAPGPISPCTSPWYRSTATPRKGKSSSTPPRTPSAAHTEQVDVRFQHTHHVNGRYRVVSHNEWGIFRLHKLCCGLFFAPRFEQNLSKCCCNNWKSKQHTLT